MAKRLANAALNIIYHHGHIINNFPFPTYEYVNVRRKELWVEFSFGLAEINVRSTDGFEVSSVTHSGLNIQFILTRVGMLRQGRFYQVVLTSKNCHDENRFTA